MSGLRIGIALGGGAARGWSHMGVLEALDKLGIKPTVVCGTSIGALVGGAYLSGNITTLNRWARSLTRFGMVKYLDIRRGRGLIGGNRLFAAMEEHLGGIEIEAMDGTYAAVATDMQTGQEVWLRSGPLSTAIKASFSIPGFFEPVQVEGRWLIDGALVNPVPVSVCRALGADFVIAVRFDVNGPISHDLHSQAAANGADVSHVLKSQIRRPPTTAMGSMLAAVNLVQDRMTRSRLVADPPDVSINVKVGHIGLMDFNRAPEMIQLGQQAVRRVQTDMLDALYHAGHGGAPIPPVDLGPTRDRDEI